MASSRRPRRCPTPLLPEPQRHLCPWHAPLVRAPPRRARARSPNGGAPPPRRGPSPPPLTRAPQGATIELDAEGKAVAVMRSSGRACLADCSVLSVPALQGAPGLSAAQVAPRLQCVALHVMQRAVSLSPPP
jgi:hypothetical protein